MSNDKPVKLSAKLPKARPSNGLETVHGALRQYGTAIVIAQVSASTVAHHVGGIQEPTASVEWVEGLPGDEEGSLGWLGSILLQLARTERTGDDRDVLIKRRHLILDQLEAYLRRRDQED